MTTTPAPTTDPTVASTSATGSARTATTMHAVVAPRYGTSEVLERRTIGRPRPGAGQVLVRVSAAGVSRGVVHLLEGTPYVVRLMGFGLRRPKQPVPGLEVAGVVDAVGDGVTRFQPGDEVFGYGDGTFAEFTVADEAKLAHKPAEVSFLDAAALVDSASTALQAVREHGGVRAGQRVLVLGASGGVGSYAVQLAADAGAEVTGTASPAKLDFVRAMGAAHVVDHRSADPLAVDQPYDVIIDIGGNRPLRRLRRALADDGRLVIVGGEDGGAIAGGIHRQIPGLIAASRGSRGAASGRRTVAFIAEESHRHLDDLAALAAAGRIAPAIDRTYPLDEAAAAIARLESGQVCGKLVIEMGR